MNRTKIEWTDYTWNPIPQKQSGLAREDSGVSRMIGDKRGHATISVQIHDPVPGGHWKTRWYSVSYGCGGCKAGCGGSVPTDDKSLIQKQIQKFQKRLQTCARKHGVKLKISYKHISLCKQPKLTDF